MTTKGLAQCAIDDVYSGFQSQLLHHATTLLTVQTHSMHFIYVSDGVVFVGEVANFRNQTYAPIHAIHGLKNNTGSAFDSHQFALQILYIIMSEHMLHSTTVSNTLN